MLHCASAGQVFMTERDIQALTRKNLPHWIAELRESEAMTRRLRKRLEALQDEIEKPCPVCGRPVAGRSDAVYCGSSCRLRAHRTSHATPKAVTSEVN